MRKVSTNREKLKINGMLALEIGNGQYKSFTNFEIKMFKVKF